MRPQSMNGGRPPSPLYQAAFDRCAAEAARSRRPVTVVTDDPFSAGEMEQRLFGSATIYAQRDFPAQSAWPIVWLMPGRSTWSSHLDARLHAAGLDARLIILSHSGRWSRLLPGAPASSLPLRVATAELAARGWQVHGMWGFQSIASILLGASARLPALFRRDDLLDRWHAAARQRFIVNGRPAAWAPLWLITAARVEGD